MSEEYIMKPKVYSKIGYMYYERNKLQCPHCKYSTFSKPLTKKGTGWYNCSQNQQTRTKTVCIKFKEKET